MARKKKEAPPKREFTPKNPDRYIGDYPIISRSSWELYFMQWLDNHPYVISWASETISVSYISPKDGRKHRYYPDFIVEYETPDGVVKEVIEIKPANQCVPGRSRKPDVKARQDMVFAVNQAKWKAAELVCELNDYRFRVLTENQLFGK